MLLSNTKKSLIAILVTQLLFACGTSETSSTVTTPNTTDIPETIGTPDNTDDTPNNTDDTADNTDDTPNNTDDTPNNTDDTPDNTDDTPDNTDDTEDSTDDAEDSTDDTADSTDDAEDSTDDTADNTDSPDNTGDTPDDDLSHLVLNCGDAEGGIENNRLNTTAKKHILCLHNETRSKVALGLFAGLKETLPFAQDMQRLQWDNELEQVAQNWANQCQWEHNANRTTEYNALAPLDINGNVSQQSFSVGENLATFGSTAYDKAELSATFAGYKLWEDEGNAWAFGTINGTEECTDSACGHFTQLIWASTYKVGCAVNFCEAGTLLQYPSTYLVCDYATAGNYIGREPYLTGSESEVCDATTSDQDSCKNGLIENVNYQEGL